MNSFGQCMSIKSLEQKYFTIFCRYALVLATHLRSGNDILIIFFGDYTQIRNNRYMKLCRPTFFCSQNTTKSQNSGGSSVFGSINQVIFFFADYTQIRKNNFIKVFRPNIFCSENTLKSKNSVAPWFLDH